MTNFSPYRTELLDEPEIQAAVEELKRAVREHFPKAEFTVTFGADPAGVHLYADADVEDSFEITDPVVDLVLDIQLERGMPVYLFTGKPLPRILEELAENGAAS